MGSGIVQRKRVGEMGRKGDRRQPDLRNFTTIRSEKGTAKRGQTHFSSEKGTDAFFGLRLQRQTAPVVNRFAPADSAVSQGAHAPRRGIFSQLAVRETL